MALDTTVISQGDQVLGACDYMCTCGVSMYQIGVSVYEDPLNAIVYSHPVFRSRLG